MDKIDSLAFVLVIVLAITSKMAGRKIPSILGTIAEDSTWYFLVIFGSHLAVELTVILGRVSMTISLALGTILNDIQSTFI